MAGTSPAMTKDIEIKGDRHARPCAGHPRGAFRRHVSAEFTTFPHPAGRHKDDHPPLSRAELPVDTVSLARYLIGKLLMREMAEGVASGRIVETEAYVIGDA